MSKIHKKISRQIKKMPGGWINSHDQKDQELIDNKSDNFTFISLATLNA